MAKIVLTAAIMDLLHDGHQNLLREMRKNGDKVVVVLHDDAACFEIKGKVPVQPIEVRARNLIITKLADAVTITHSTDPADAFEKIVNKYSKDDILFMRGDDNKDYPGRWYIEKRNIPVEFIPYTEGVSSTKMRQELIDDRA